MSWQPSPEILGPLVQIIEQSLQPPSGGQRQAVTQLNQIYTLRDCANYLTHVFCADALSADVRQTAGLLLKNFFRDSRKYRGLEPPLRAHLRALLPPSLNATVRALRQTACTVIAVILGAGGVQDWPELVSSIVGCLETQESGEGLDTCTELVQKLLEDFPGEINARLGGGVAGEAGTLAGVLVPRLIRVFALPHASSAARIAAARSLNLLLPENADGVQEGLEDYKNALLQVAVQLHASKTGPLLAVTCTGLVQLLKTFPHVIEPHFADLGGFMMQQAESTDEEVAIEAVSFFGEYFSEAGGEGGLDLEPMRPLLASLCQTLMARMVYEDSDDDVIRALEADERGARRGDQDLGHLHAKGDEGGEEEEEEEDLGPDPSSSWSLRQAAAWTLDMAANAFEGAIMPAVMQHVPGGLASQDWHRREAAVLAMGAIATGCASELRPHILSLMSSMAALVSDTNPLVRGIAAWTCGRFTSYVADLLTVPEEADQARSVLDVAMQSVLRAAVSDKNWIVRQKAAGALADMFENEAGRYLDAPRLAAIAQALGGALAAQGRETLRALTDAASSLFSSCGSRLRHDLAACRAVLEPIAARTAATGDWDRALLPLLDVMGSAAASLGPSFDVVARPVFDRCLRVATLYSAAREGQYEPGSDPFEFQEDFVISSLDCISNMCEGLKASVEPLVAAAPALFDILMAALQPLAPPGSDAAANDDASPDLHRSALGVLGDLAKAAPVHLRPRAPAFVQAALAIATPANHNAFTKLAFSNALWAMGEFAEGLGPAPFNEQTANALASSCLWVLYNQNSGQIHATLVETAAATLGKLSLALPDLMAPSLAQYMTPWCMGLRRLVACDDKVAAFRGLLGLLHRNPSAALSSPAVFVSLAGAIATWTQPEGQTPLASGVREVLAQVAVFTRECEAQLRADGRWGPWTAHLGGAQGPVMGKLVGLGCFSGA